MSQDELLVTLCQAVVKECDPPDNWVKLMMVGDVEPGAVGMSGYAFDPQNEWKAVSPGEESLDLLEKLWQAMTQQAGRPWLSCLIRIGRDGRIGADFEYDDEDRWAVRPATLQTRIAEFAATPV